MSWLLPVRYLSDRRVFRTFWQNIFQVYFKESQSKLFPSARLVRIQNYVLKKFSLINIGATNLVNVKQIWRHCLFSKLWQFYLRWVFIYFTLAKDLYYKKLHGISNGSRFINLWTYELVKSITRYRSIRSEIFFKTGVLKNFANVTGKHPCWTLFLMKL